MNEKLLDVNISRILSLTGVVNEYVLGTDIVLGEAHGDRVKDEQSILDVLHYPIRLDCYVFFFRLTRKVPGMTIQRFDRLCT